MQPERHPDLVRLEQTYPLGELAMTTTEGLRWRSRMQASDAYFRDYSWDWAENQALLTDVRALTLKYGTYVAIAYAIVQNLVADTYYRNPDPLVQDKGGNRDLSRMLSDVFKAIHADVDTERKMKDALTDQSWAGFGMLWTSFQQKGYFDQAEVDAETGEQGAYVTTNQRIVLRRISPWRVRFDPEGRDWDLSDHGYIAFLYSPKLAQLMRDESLSDEDRRRLMAHVRGGQAQPVRYGSLSDTSEEDPELIPVPCWHIWSRTNKMTYRQPVGTAFTFQPQPWPEESAEADEFPVRYMAKNREPEDEQGLCGFIGVPDLRLTRPHIYAIQRLEALFLSANQHVINKYFTMKGALEQQAQEKLATDKQYQVIEVDPDAFNKFPAEMRDKVKFSDILALVPQHEFKELRHLDGIRHELDMIAQIIGQASADRGGLSDAETATESRGMQQRLAYRLSTLRHEAGKHYQALCRLFYIILKQRQTLPIQYQMTTAYNEKVWAAFSADTLRELDLHFEYAVGSSEPRTREEEFALRERAAAILMPMLAARGDMRGQMKVARDLVELLNLRNVEQYFNDDAIEYMKELVAIMDGLQKGTVDPANREVVKRQIELVSMLANELLTEQDLTEVVAQGAGQDAPSTEGMGSLPSAPTPGQADYDAAARGSAAAGIDGGMVQ